MSKTLLVYLSVFFLAFSGTMSGQEIRELAEDALVIEGFEISGNKVTKDYVILREMVFAEGDTIKKIELIPDIQRSKENLLNTALFNFVSFDIRHLQENRIIVLIDVTERWYIWPTPILEHADRNVATFLKDRSWDKINYGFWLYWRNFLGRNQILSWKVRLGYMKEFQFRYEMPNLGRKQQHTISLAFDYDRQNEIYARTQYNKPVEYRPKTRPAEESYEGIFLYRIRPKYYNIHEFSLRYVDWRVGDSVAIYNPEYLGGGATRNQHFDLKYRWTYDRRDSKAYPLEGLKLGAEVNQHGLGIMKGFDYASTQLAGVLMFHSRLGGPFYFYNASKGRFSTRKNMPHYLNRALGYWEYLSAYEPYVIDGSDYVISKYGIKFEALKPSTFTLPYIPWEQFNRVHYALYINLFADVGYVRNDIPDLGNTMNNQLQSSLGIGIDLVTYYDVVFRFEYSMNRHGEHGFFFHVGSPFERW